MKTLIFLALSFLSAQIFAAECKIPKSCDVQSSEFSTGGGDKFFILMEVDCKKPDGSITKYVHQKGSVSGLLGFGRWTTPEKIDFVKSKDDNFDKLVCEY